VSVFSGSPPPGRVQCFAGRGDFIAWYGESCMGLSLLRGAEGSNLQARIEAA